MGYSRCRKTSKGLKRYTAYYLDSRGDERSAGTFGKKKEADKAWQRAEGKVSEGRGGQLIRGRQTFKTYVEEKWLPNLSVEQSTLEGYTYVLYAHIMDYFETSRMMDIYANNIREWIKTLKSNGMTAANIQHVKTQLSSILTSAVKDEVIVGNPCLLVDIDPVPLKPLRIVTPEEFDIFHAALPDEMSKLLVETGIETGCRWGELSELRPKDFDFDTCVVTISRAVVQLVRKFHPEGKRFLVKEYPKDKEFRYFKVNRALCRRIQVHIEKNGLADDDLLFWYVPKQEAELPALDADPKTLGKTKPNEKGRTYQHGTTSAYTAAKCRCDHCKKAMAIYRAKRRAEGKDQPRKVRNWDTDGHIPKRWFRDRILRPALKKSGIAVDIAMHKLRHAHASWALKGGADLHIVKERLGHANISTTERYLHAMDEGDETALEAIESFRQSQRSKGRTQALVQIGTVDEQSHQGAMTTEQVLEEMKRIDQLQAHLRDQLSQSLSSGA
ncbi:integrase family protein [Stackebrandtia nassauensis DSM 44728]|uniref:Integrase family protein n=1 Tax=Stackebrandtia nassauensis (strain DSM 44728 / CIP 108903 / NRRL B-16338 / NBRC 102104 / LLR-40K-21) TaxID=446470 RepID=D3PUX8_STANL|nr:integrase family protein [Stackebrandtia nassauensis DSM 44728]